MDMEIQLLLVLDCGIPIEDMEKVGQVIKKEKQCH
jgi:hypothetical protein